MRRVLWLFRRRMRESELDEELRFHLEQETADLQAEGLSPDEARWAARRDLGNLTLIQEDTRATWGWPAVESFWQDFRYAARGLRRTPAFTATAVLSLALGVGVTTGTFTLVNALLLRPLPVADPSSLVQCAFTLRLNEANPGQWNHYFDYPQYDRLRRESRSLAGLFAGTTVGRVNLETGGSPGLAQLDAYSGNFFTVLGLRPAAGRLFTDEDDRAGAAVIVLSDRYWRARFASDPAVAGRTVTLNRVPFTILGVTPPNFRGLTPGGGPDLWMPIRALDRLADGAPARWTQPFRSWLLLAGRLRPGVAHAGAEAELDTLHRQLLRQQAAASPYGLGPGTRQLVVDSRLVLRDASTGVFNGLRETYALPLKILMGLALVVLLAACTNLANLLLARGASRRRELSLRLALGAGRTRLMRHLLTECLLLAAMGGALAGAAAWTGSRALLLLLATGERAPALDLHPDLRVVAASAGATLAALLLFGLASAWRTTAVTGLRATPGRRFRTLDRALIAGQVALSVTLLAVAGLFLQTFRNLWMTDLGFRRDNVLLFSVDAKLAGLTAEQAPRMTRLYGDILQRLRALPGVEAAAASVVRPVDSHFSLVDQVNEIDSRPLSARDVIHVAWNAVTDGYFDTTGMRLLAGRDIRPDDDASAPPIVVVNQTFAARAFPAQDPIGHRLGPATIVGVVRDARYNGPHDPPRPVLYYPLFQRGPGQAYGWGFVSYEIRAPKPAALAEAVRQAVHSVDRGLPLFRITTLRVQVAEALRKEQLLAALSVFFGLLTLALASIGLYGMIAGNVARRTAELGIRTALGATRRHLCWIIQREALLLTAAGIAVGLPLAIAGAHAARSILYEVSPDDPATLAFAAAALLLAGALAALAPLRRVLGIDPAATLRAE